MRKVGVVHLVWGPLGLEPFRRFLDSYRRHPAGLNHRLIVVFNGFLERTAIAEYEQLLHGEEYHGEFLTKPVQDIAAYLHVARVHEEEAFCFLNSYSVILQDDWLAKLHTALCQERIGMVGATGSWESMYSSVLKYTLPPARPWTPRGFYTLLKQRFALQRAQAGFAPFPNYHLRTNAFMVERSRLLSLNLDEVRNKDDAHRFESGRHGLTARLIKAGLEPRVVDRQGRAWSPEQWAQSATFSSGHQENLLVADNRTRDYEQAPPSTQRMLAELAWGT